jgi:AbrB family looped-hinge helix DNA binding protein
MIIKEAVATVTSKGQITVPVEVRRHLGVGQKDKLAFQIDENGEVRVRKIKYPTIASIAGMAGSLPRPMSWEEVLEIAHDDVAKRYIEKQQRGA